MTSVKNGFFGKKSNPASEVHVDVTPYTNLAGVNICKMDVGEKL
jgi:hypothetical protein